MELEFKKRSLICYETVLDVCVNHEETMDVIVPDSSPDILRILGAYGNVFVKDEEISDGRYMMAGMLCGWVLYVSEGDLNVRRLDINLPISHTFDHLQLSSDQIGTCTASIISVDAREINPRKITVRANIALCAKTYREEKLEFPQDVSNATEYGIECKTAKVMICAPIAIKKKNIHIGDDIEMTASQPEFASPLRHTVEVDDVETKVIGKKAVVKGNLGLTCLYLTKSGEIARFKRSVPFSQILEIEELCEDCKVEIQLQPGDLKFDPQYDMSGDVHYFALSLPLHIYAIVMTQSELETLEDLYSTKQLLKVRNREQKVCCNCEHFQRPIPVSETVLCEVQPEEILDVVVCAEPVRKRKTEDDQTLSNRIQARILYRGTDGGVYCTVMRTETSSPVTTQNEICCVSFQLCDLNVTIGQSSEILVKFCVKYEMNELETVVLEVPCFAELEQEEVSSKPHPSVLVRKIKQGDTLWKLAKEYKTTIEEIMIANSLENDQINVGDMILISKKR